MSARKPAVLTLARLLAWICSACMLRLAAVIAVYPRRSMGQPPYIALNRIWSRSFWVEMTLVLAW
ncbi:hypothetical protein D3C77_716770 [compost metagenome]